jgi:hypothetical protein
MVDQVSDLNRAVFYQLSREFTIPEMVKEAAFATADDVAQLPASAFADPQRRQYPMHTPADAWLSWAYFQKQAANYTDDRRTIIKAAIDRGMQLWQLTPPAATPVEKTAAAESKIVYMVDGQPKHEVTIRYAGDLDKVATDLMFFRCRYPYDTVNSVAKQVLALAPAYGFEITGSCRQTLEKMAAMAVGTVDDVRDTLARRVSAQPMLDERCRTAQAEVEKQAKCGVVSPDMLDKVARFVDAIDRLSGLHQVYGVRLPPPEETLFRITASQNQSFQKSAIKLQDGTILNEKEAQSAPVVFLLQSLTGREVPAADARQ